VIVADVDDEVRSRRRCARRHRGERPLRRVLARLECVVRCLDPAPGVADDHDAARVRLGHGQRTTGNFRARNTRGIALSQTSTGKAEGFDSAGSLRVGRSGTVAGRARTSIVSLRPSRSIKGTLRRRLVITRATGCPASPSTTNA
jgi:hypothetical protein